MGTGSWKCFLLFICTATDWRQTGSLRAPLVANLAMNNVVRDSIELIGIKPSRIRWGTQGMPQRYERLAVVCTASAGMDFSTLHVPSSVSRSIAAKVPGRGRHKIWVSREKATRTLIDEPALCEILESQGWIIARLGDTPLRHQIELFKGAEVIAGVLGAGLTNLVFAGVPLLKFCLFAPSQMPGHILLDVVTVQTTIIQRGALRARIQGQGGIQLGLQVIDDHRKRPCFHKRNTKYTLSSSAKRLHGTPNGKRNAPYPRFAQGYALP